MQSWLLGYVCLVRLERLAQLLPQPGTREICRLLPARGAQWSGKRQLEYLGGRMAAKVAAAASYPLSATTTAGWPAFVIRTDIDEQRICEMNGKYAASVGITHSGRWAAAVAVAAGRVALDLEDLQAKEIVGHAFHSLERQQVSSPELFRELWTLKETVAKLSGKGILGYENEILTFNHGRKRWIGVLFPGFLAGHPLVAVHTNRHFSVSVGLDSGSRRNQWGWKRDA